jgi:hypothetical protein
MIIFTKRAGETAAVPPVAFLPTFVKMVALGAGKLDVIG